MTISTAREIASHWREALGLMHWNVSVRWAKRGDDCEDCFGMISWFTEEAKAEMVLHRRRANEDTIIHELLHLRCEGHRPAPVRYDPLYEQAINHIAKALLKTT